MMQPAMERWERERGRGFKPRSLVLEDRQLQFLVKHEERAMGNGLKKSGGSRRERACCLGWRILGEGRKVFIVGI